MSDCALKMIQIHCLFFSSPLSQQHIPAGCSVLGHSVVLTSLSFLSRHSTHSSDEAGFNDPSLLENLQSNHVSNVRVPCLLPAPLTAVKDKIKRDFEPKWKRWHNVFLVILSRLWWHGGRAFSCIFYLKNDEKTVIFHWSHHFYDHYFWTYSSCFDGQIASICFD